jgi:hypothetical protein
LEGAESELREAIRLKPDYFLAHISLVSVLTKKKDFAGVFNECREMVRLDRKQSAAIVGLLPAQGSSAHFGSLQATEDTRRVWNELVEEWREFEKASLTLKKFRR